jgi:predicted anti-sigma-YlaC factor YlaD
MSSNCLQDRLSEYIDGELGLDERAAIEAHLAECAACARIVSDLRRVVRRAEALDDRAPARELWSGVAARIGATVKPDASSPDQQETARVLPFARRSRRMALSVPQLLAASIALVAVSGSTVWFAVQRRLEHPAPQTVEQGPVNGQPMALPASITTPYDDAAADLVRILESERERLAPETIRVIEENLTIIDHAVARAREALASDPESDYLREHLAQTMRQKLMLLRRVTSLTNAS